MPAVYTEIERPDSGGDIECVEVRLDFTATCTARACAATRTDPAWGAEYEFSLDDISFELRRGAAEPAPLTDAERAQLATWFAHGDGRELAYQKAIDAEEGADDRADYLYDRWRDRQMEERDAAASFRRAA